MTFQSGSVRVSLPTTIIPLPKEMMFGRSVILSFRYRLH